MGDTVYNGWILKRHSVDKGLKECEPDESITFLCDSGLQTQSFAENMSSLMLWPHRKFALVRMMSTKIL